MSFSPHRLLLLAACASMWPLLTGCYDRNDLTAPDEVLLLTAEPSSIPADGFSTARIVARVSTSADRDLAVEFKATDGAITSDLLAPDASGRVVALLKSTTTPQSVVVTASVKRGQDVEASRSVTVTFAPVDGTSVIRLSLSEGELPADGASSVLVTADANPASGSRTIHFATTNGSFAPDTDPLHDQDVPADARGRAQALLYAPRDIGIALVTVSAGGFSASDTVTFVRALPRSIALEVTPLSVAPSETEEVRVVAVLSREPGKVTVGTRVDFSITNDATGGSFGRFQNIGVSDEDEQLSAELVVGTGAPVGLATIVARVPGTNVSARTKLTIAVP